MEYKVCHNEVFFLTVQLLFSIHSAIDICIWKSIEEGKDILTSGKISLPLHWQRQSVWWGVNLFIAQNLPVASGHVWPQGVNRACVNGGSLSIALGSKGHILGLFQADKAGQALHSVQGESCNLNSGTEKGIQKDIIWANMPHPERVVAQWQLWHLPTISAHPALATVEALRFAHSRVVGSEPSNLIWKGCNMFIFLMVSYKIPTSFVLFFSDDPKLPKWTPLEKSGTLLF